MANPKLPVAPVASYASRLVRHFREVPQAESLASRVLARTMAQDEVDRLTFLINQMEKQAKSEPIRII